MWQKRVNLESARASSIHQRAAGGGRAGGSRVGRVHSRAAWINTAPGRPYYEATHYSTGHDTAPWRTTMASLISHIVWGKTTTNNIQYFLNLVLFNFCTCCISRCVHCCSCIVYCCSCTVRIVVVVLCIVVVILCVLL